MLAVRFEYTLKSRAQLQFELRIMPNAGAESVALSILYDGKDEMLTNTLHGYQLWSESGYAAIARALRASDADLPQLSNDDDVMELTVSVRGAPANMSQRHELSKITYSAHTNGGSVQVSGPVFRAGFSIEIDETRRDVSEISRKIFEFCAVQPLNYGTFPSPPLVPKYSGGSVADFVFVDELPFGVCLWFIAFVKEFKKNSIYREGTVAHFGAWQAFLNGDIQ
jgi:hypothetical protein